MHGVFGRVTWEIPNVIKKKKNCLEALTARVDSRSPQSTELK